MIFYHINYIYWQIFIDSLFVDKIIKHERFLSITGAQPESSMRTHTRSLMTIHNAWNMAKTNLRVSICYFPPEPVIFGYFDLRHQRDNTSTDLEASPDRWSQDSGIDAIHLQNEPQWQETNLQDLCAQRRFRSACATQADLNLRWAHFVQPRMHSFFVRTKRALIRLRGCAGWFESSLGAHVRRYGFRHYGSYSAVRYHIYSK